MAVSTFVKVSNSLANIPVLNTRHRWRFTNDHLNMTINLTHSKLKWYGKKPGLWRVFFPVLVWLY